MFQLLIFHPFCYNNNNNNNNDNNNNKMYIIFLGRSVKIGKIRGFTIDINA